MKLISNHNSTVVFLTSRERKTLKQKFEKKLYYAKAPWASANEKEAIPFYEKMLETLSVPWVHWERRERVDGTLVFSEYAGGGLVPCPGGDYNCRGCNPRK